VPKKLACDVALAAEFYEFSTLQFILINLRWAGAPIRKKL